MFVTLIDTRFGQFVTLISETHNQVLQLPVTTSGKKKTEENWSERLLLTVYIVVCYFSLIIFSTVELISFATRFARRELSSLLSLIF